MRANDVTAGTADCLGPGTSQVVAGWGIPTTSEKVSFNSWIYIKPILIMGKGIFLNIQVTLMEKVLFRRQIPISCNFYMHGIAYNKKLHPLWEAKRTKRVFALGKPQIISV